MADAPPAPQGKPPSDRTPINQDTSAAYEGGEDTQRSCMAACCVNVPKAILFIINTAFLVFACILAGIAGWALENQTAIAELIPRTGLNMLLGASFVLAAVACMGFYGALDQNKTILKLYSCIGCLTIIVEIIAGAAVLSFLGSLQESKDGSDATDLDRRVNNVVQQAYCDCCNQTVGIMSGCSVVNPSNKMCKLLPSTFKSGPSCNSTMQYRVAMIDWVDSNMKPIGFVTIGFVLPQILALFAACCLLCKPGANLNDAKNDDEDKFYKKIQPGEREGNVQGWPFVIVFGEKAQKNEGRDGMKDVLRRLHAADLRTLLYKSSDGELIFCKVTGSRQRLEAEANRTDFKLRLDPERLLAADIAMNAPRGRVMREDSAQAKATAMKIEDVKGEGSFFPYHYIHAKYVSPPDAAQARHMTPEEVAVARHRQTLYRIDRFTRMKFREIDVLKLIWSVMEAPENSVPPGAGMALEHLWHHGHLEEYFPLHHIKERKRLMKRWYVWCSKPWFLPTEPIRKYFGEKIALYFSFLSHYTQWLLAPSFIGLLVYVHQRAADNVSVPELPFFGIFIALWATLFLESWKRKQSTHVMKWGMKGFEAEETTRPQFNEVAAEIPSPVTGLPTRWYSHVLYRGKISVSTVVVGVMIAIVLVCVTSVFLLRAFLVKSQRDQKIPAGTAGYIAAFVNAVQIHILNMVYAKVARRLNDWENHPTDTVYEDNLIAKTFCFQFINSYFNLFYVAFIKNNVTLLGEKQTCKLNDNGIPDCLADLSSQLGTIFVTRLVLGNFLEVVLPWLKNKIQIYRDNKKLGADRELSQAELENDLLDYETFQDYSEVVIQFGYVTLFVVAFPLAPLLAFISNYIEARVDALKVLMRCCRPEPSGAEDIGTWYPIMEIMGIVAVITNMGAVFFSGSVGAFGITSTLWKTWGFIILEHAVFALKYLLAQFVPDTPHGVKLQLAREQYLNAKHMLGDKDDIVSMDDIRMELAGEVGAPTVHDNERVAHEYVRSGASERKQSAV